MLKRVVLLAVLASTMGIVSSLAADLKPTDKRTFPVEIKTDDKGNIVAVEAGPNNWKLDREAYPIFEEAAKEAAWNTKHVDTEEELVITIPVSIVMLSGDKPKKK